MGSTGLNGWNIRATSSDGQSVGWQLIDFNKGTAEDASDIRLLVTKSQRCPTGTAGPIIPGGSGSEGSGEGGSGEGGSGEGGSGEGGSGEGGSGEGSGGEGENNG